MDSILNSTKKILGIDANYMAFDVDIIMCINSALSTLSQLGIGPEEGFAIEDDSAEWEDLLQGNKNLNAVKTYVHLKTRLIFDPPTNGFTVTAIQEQINELGWRLNVVGENVRRPLEERV